MRWTFTACFTDENTELNRTDERSKTRYAACTTATKSKQATIQTEDDLCSNWSITKVAADDTMDV